MSTPVIINTDIKEVPLFRRGKVRDVYDLGDSLLIVSTDRISCFDVILPNGIPDKGKVLTSISRFWFDFTRDIIENHFISDDVKDYPAMLKPYETVLKGRSMLVRKSRPLPVECIVRGYLSGSGWKEYQKTQAICGITLPKGLRESDKLPEIIFTPSTKADVGHDVNVTQDYIERQIGAEVARRIKEVSIALYKKASIFAEERGIIIADTKFEFGKLGDKLILIDEALTPDSSRFWPKDEYVPGKPQASFDKQFVRDYLETLDWNKTPPGPVLPDRIVDKTREKYLQALNILTRR
ncbi:MAG: phosphoribosylaminoimidazolesuccinocarboxamide synthase [Candidatus Omnitrophica bacterium]|nr:phosphoribosylaminoimidazolesuccinocarboxamide synthase [Candidatus Omnitrophota bacterium]